jgi:RNA polymerase sigma-70 factor (ECF subfamily)
MSIAHKQPIISDPFTITLIRIKAKQLCRRSDFSRSDCEDLQQAMRLYVLEKARLFDPARGNLEAFVTNAIKSWVAMELRYRNREKRSESFRAISLDSTPVTCDGDVTSLSAVLLEEDGDRRNQLDSASSQEQFELREALARVIGNLDPEDRALLACVAEKGVRATARELGISWRQVANALNRIRQECESAGLGAN